MASQKNEPPHPIHALPIVYNTSHLRSTYNATATPNTAAPTAKPAPNVLPTAPPVAVADAAAVAEPPAAEVVLPVASATLTPNSVVVTTDPLIVVVTTLVAVVLAAHPVHVVHGAAVLHGPSVHPVHVESGHALVPHHWFQGPLTQAPELVHWPQALFGPNGHPPAHGPPAEVGHGPPVVGQFVRVVQSEFETHGPRPLQPEGQALPPEVTE